MEGKQMKNSQTAMKNRINSNIDFRISRAWIELDMNNLRHNIGVMSSLLPSGCQLMSVVKANAYGHGAVEIARELNAHSIRAFCVASVLEGIELREHSIDGEILIAGYTHPEQFYLLQKYRLTQTVIDCCYAKVLNNYDKSLKVHMKIDTGMRRFGERSENIDGILEVFKYKNLIITGIFTHLCVTDSDQPEDKAFTQKQIDRFNSVLSEIEGQGFQRPKTHVQSGYGVLNYPDLIFDYARVGTALYGMLYTRSDTKKHNIGLRPVLSLKARIGATKSLFAGEALGYGLTFTAQHDMKIAVLSIGYADGIPRCLSCGVGHVLVNGKKAPIIGRICMDQMMVDITGIANVRQGDIAVIIGKSGNAEITACEIAEQAKTVSTEILSQFGGMLGRVVCDS
jgi:serine/alanine racemase